MKSELIDTHTHLFDECFVEDIESVVGRAKEKGVTIMLLPNIDMSTVEPLKRVSQNFRDYCYPMMGLHPTSVKENYKEELANIADELRENRNLYVAIGEIGLDYYWDTTYKEAQKEVFKYQLDLAVSYDLPVAIHCREALDDMIDILSSYVDTNLRGVFHSFTGDKNDAQRLLVFERFLFGLNGVLTFKNSKALKEAVDYIPIERIILETDSPYLAPVPNRGKRNESSYVCFVAEELSTLKRMSYDEVARYTTENAKRLFNI